MLLESLALDNASLFIVGDFNIHMDNPTSRTGAANMLDLLSENDLIQRVHGQTHRGGGSHPGSHPDSRDREHGIECAEPQPGPLRPQGHYLLAAHLETTGCQKAGRSATFQANHCGRPVPGPASVR